MLLLLRERRAGERGRVGVVEEVEEDEVSSEVRPCEFLLV